MGPRRGSAIGWAALDCLTCLILVIYTLIAPPTHKVANIPTKGYYAITQTCPVSSTNDVDLYVRDPSGATEYFASMTAGLMHLEQDIIPGYNTVQGNIRLRTGDNERVILLGFLPGEYIVDEHMYKKWQPGSETCQVSLWSIRDGFQQITTSDVTLQRLGSVETAFRFTLSSKGKVIGINHLPRDIVSPAND